MKKVILDSDLIIDYLRTGTGSLIDILEEQGRGRVEIHISSLTVMELFAGQSSRSMLTQIQSLIDQWRVIGLSTELARFAGELKRDLNLNMTVTDLIIAATAVWLKASLATKNKKHFASIDGLKFYQN